MTKKDTGSQNANASKNFNAFSNMNMPPLWDMNKATDAHHKNMETMKQAHGILSETFKEVSAMHSQVVQKNVEKVKASMSSMIAKSKDKNTVHEHMNKVKQHHQELSEKMKASTGKVLDHWKSKVDEIKDQHAKLMTHLNEQKQTHAEALKAHLDEAKAHQQAISESLKNSTQKIMDLMKNTANSHMNSH